MKKHLLINNPVTYIPVGLLQVGQGCGGMCESRFLNYLYIHLWQLALLPTGSITDFAHQGRVGKLLCVSLSNWLAIILVLNEKIFLLM